MHEQLFQIVLILLGIAIIPFLARKFKIPSAALEIVLGIILFNTFMTNQPEWFNLLKEFGFIYLMFIAGMELDLKNLFRESELLLWYILLPILSFIITPIIFVVLGFSFFTGIVVSVVSAGITIPVLKETNMLKTKIGNIIMGITLTGELISIIVLTGIDIYHQYGLSIMAGFEVIKLFILLLLAFLFLKILHLTAWWHPKWVARVMESEDPVEEGIRAIIAIAFVGALFAHYAGVEAILGSFMAGVIFNYVFRSKGDFEEKINAIGFGFFIPFFFVGIGAGFNLKLLTSLNSIIFAFFMAAMIFISNIYPILFSSLMKIKIRESLSVALLSSSPLSMIVVAGALGMKMKLLETETYNILVLSALLSSLIFPFLFRILSKKIVDI